MNSDSTVSDRVPDGDVLPLDPDQDDFSFTCLGHQTFQSPQIVATIPIATLPEASGLATSRQNPGIIWTHNDNTGDARIYAFSITGELLATYTVGLHANAIDVEDISIGPGPIPGVDYLYVGHIGDNNNVRSEVFVYRFPEPTVVLGQTPINLNAENVEKIRLAYPSGSTAPSHRDAETLMVDLNGDIYLFTKRTSPFSLVYRAAYPQSVTSLNALEYRGSVSFYYPTGGDLSPNGRLIGMRTYTNQMVHASVFVRDIGQDFYDALVIGERCDISLTSEYQGEAFAWDSESLGFYSITEIFNSGLTLAPLRYYAR